MGCERRVGKTRGGRRDDLAGVEDLDDDGSAEDEELAEGGGFAGRLVNLPV
jgi:hypothetical protein